MLFRSVQITQIGLDAYSDGSDLVAWTTDLKDGSPLAGVTIQSNNGSTTTLSGADGIARFKIPKGAGYLVASKGGDQAILTHSTYYWSDDIWSASSTSDILRWYVFDDRQMYRPGEQVHIKGWLRRIGGGKNGDIGLVGDTLRSINYQITDPQGNDLGSGKAQVNSLGGFDFALTLPQVTNLGTAQINFTAEGDLGGLGEIQYNLHFRSRNFADQSLKSMRAMKRLVRILLMVRLRWQWKQNTMRAAHCRDRKSVV